MKIAYFSSLWLTACLALVAMVCGCAGMQAGPTIKSGYDLGVELCQLYYTQHPELARALTPKDICQVAEAVQPFVDVVTSESPAAGQRSAAAIHR
jgi:hypothetical protein